MANLPDREIVNQIVKTFVVLLAARKLAFYMF